MPLLRLNQVSFTWQGPSLLDDVDLQIDEDERIGLVGRNGSGKSTLMKILAGEIEPDHGDIRRAGGLRISRLIQDVPDDMTGSVADIIGQGVSIPAGQIDHAASALNGPCDHAESWKIGHAVQRVLSRMNLDGDAPFATLSSGMKRRVLLGRALAQEPDILLLDEPTNHLDIAAISWLERFLKGYHGTLVFVTHDRMFLESLATRIIEIDRGRLFDWACDYRQFLQRRQAAWDAEDKQNLAFDRKLAQEEVWIRQGIKARRTRNEGRVRALKKLREERQQRRQRSGLVRMQAVQAEQSGQLVIEANDVSFSYQQRAIVKNLSLLVTRGDRIGVIGPNGSGKTTLLKLLLGELPPSEGAIRHGTRLEVLYFDQLRAPIDDAKSVVENVGEGQEQLLIQGSQRHIYGYLQDFLFTPERARQAARYLSGGERNRLLLARLFKRPSNVLVLDEPTNDLDMETLELLEELVMNYQGTLLLVSHDRAFLNNVVTSTLVLEGDGQVKEYAGGYDDYLAQRDSPSDLPAEVAKKAARPVVVSQDASATRPSKLSFQERRELESLPQRIEEHERQRDQWHAVMADPEFYKQNGSEIAAARTRLEALEQELHALYLRWEELEHRA